MSVLPSPSNEMIIDIEKMLFRYIWNGKPDKIKREFMKMPKAMGGMSVPDISLMKNLALKIAWVQRIINNDNKWNTLLRRKIPIDLKLFWYCNIHHTDMHVITNHISHVFLKHVIEAWFNYSFYNPTTLNTYIINVFGSTRT